MLDYTDKQWFCAYCNHGYKIMMEMLETDKPSCYRHPNIILTYIRPEDRTSLKPRYKKIDIN